MGKAYSKAARRRRLKHGTRDLAKPKSQVTLARWDQGATGQANRVGLVTEERGDRDAKTGKIINPNSVKGVRRVDMLEVYHKRGWISDRGYTAGEALRDAWSATQCGKGVDLSQDRVDATAKPDAAIAMQIDRVSRLLSISRRIPADDEAILHAVACEGRAISHLRQYRGMYHEKGKTHLREALDRLAKAMGG